MQKKYNLFLILLMIFLMLSSCYQNTKSSGKNKESESSASAIKSFPIKTRESQQLLTGETLSVALPKDTKFQGMWANEFIEDKLDQDLFEFVDQPLFNLEQDFKYGTGGIAEIEFHTKEKYATITLMQEVKWSDGVDLTSEDVIFPYEVIGSPLYQGKRYDEEMQNIVGMTEYHQGLSSTISGIKQIDAYTVEIYFKKMHPDIAYGSGIWNYASPKHYLKDISIDELANAPEIRENPVTLGPFFIDSTADGKIIHYKANEHYYLGLPKVSAIDLTLVPSEEILSALKSKDYDIILNMPSDSFAGYEAVAGYTNVGREELYYSYLGFKMGRYNSETNQVETDYQRLTSNLNLRKALAYGIDSKEVGEKVYGGLRMPANSVILPVFSSLYDSSIPRYSKDLDKANQLLDEAGFVDRDQDGYREGEDGHPLTLQLAAMSGQESSQTVADYYKNSWEALGIKIVYTSGELLPMEDFYNRLQTDDPEIDIFLAAWGVDPNPNPTDTFSSTTRHNFTRFSSAELNNILAKINSADSFDSAYQKKAYQEFQQYIYDEVPVVPLNYNYRITAVNQRVANFDYHYVTEGHRWFNVGVTSLERE